MIRLVILGFAAVALFAVTTVLRSHSISGNEVARIAIMPSVHELQHAIDASNLPVEEVDDRSVVYPQRSSR